jgi:hypothetical protein
VHGVRRKAPAWRQTGICHQQTCEFTQAAGLNNDVEWIVSEIIRSPEFEVLSADRQINASSENNMTDLNRYYKIGQGIYFFLDFGPLIWATNHIL